MFRCYSCTIIRERINLCLLKYGCYYGTLKYIGVWLILWWCGCVYYWVLIGVCVCVFCVGCVVRQ